jgi:subtilase family serine protease
MMTIRRWSWAAVLSVSLLLLSALPAGAAPSTRATLAGSTPSWATASNFKSSTPTTDNVGFRLYLGWNNSSGLQAFVDSVSDPRSGSYGQYLTPAQFHAQYSPSQASVNQVKSWLTSQGFTVDYVPANNHYVAAEGTVAQASAAFAVTFGQYSVNGLTLRAPSTDVSVPTSLAGVVDGVLGLDESTALVHNNIATEPDATGPGVFKNAPPCSTYWAQQVDTTETNPYGSGPLPYAPCGYTPQQVKGAYGIGGTYTGTGQTVAIIDAYASPTIVADVNQWSTNRGVPELAANQLTQVVAPGTYRVKENSHQDPQGWYGEETLDIEAVHGMAPDARIVYVGAPNNYQDLDAALNHVVDRHLAQIVTNSYGFNTELLPAGYILPQEQTIMQGAAEGIGIYFSSGDNSDETLVQGYATADWPASSPYVTAVGGTSIAVGSTNNYLFETGWGTTRSRWNTTCSTTPTWCPPPPGRWLYGAGGGVSRIFAEPSYQVGVPGIATAFKAQGRSGRAVPDIGAIADPNTGYLIGETQTLPDGSQQYSEYRIGGTSLSSPIMAGIMALADQAKGSPHGFANPALYSLGAGAYNDITNPRSTVAVVRVDYVNGFDGTGGTLISLRTMNQTLTLKTTAGWDDVTGFGSPNSTFIGALSH